MDWDGTPLVLWAGNVGTHDLFERAEAVQPGGFQSMTLFTSDVERYLETGNSLERLRRELEARGGPVSTIDPYLGWYPGWEPVDDGSPAAAFFQAGEDDVLQMCEGLHAPFLTVIAPFDGPDRPIDEVVESLGAFVDRAAEAGVRAHLEFIPPTKFGQIAPSLALVEAVDRDNLGLLFDAYHLGRGGAQPDDIDSVPLERIFQIQVNDAKSEQVGTFIEDTLTRRLAPGEGELPVAEYIRRVAAKGALPPIGPEIFNPRMESMSALDASVACGSQLRRYLDEL